MRLTAARVTLALFAAALSGCSAATAPPASPAQNPATLTAAALGQPANIQVRKAPGTTNRSGWLSPQAKNGPLVYVSDFAANAIEIYPAGPNNPAPVGEITAGISGPLGNFVDADGTLYVANSSNNTVTEYRKGSINPSVTLSSGINAPITVAVDSERDVAVGEFAQGTVLEFLAHHSKPHVSIALPLPEGLAFNRTRELYAAWNQNSGALDGQVTKCRPVQPQCRNLGLSEGQSGGLALDKAGNLILGDQTNQVINIYAPHATSPSRTISTAGHDPYKFELNASEKKLYVADIDNAIVVIYDYATGVESGTISTGLQSAWGVSLSPAAPYAP